MTQQYLRKDLSAPGMYSLIHNKALKVPDARVQTAQIIPLADAIMSAVAMFGLKDPSMLSFCERGKNPAMLGNLNSLFQIGRVPSDTALREILDPIPTREFQNFFKPLFAMAQRGKALEEYTYLAGKYLLSIDGTGCFSSPTIHCGNCCVKTHRKGGQTYYHQMESGVIVHPDKKLVIPIAPEPISNNDGSSKNDCERNASKRLLEDFRREHPHLPVIVVEDGLASNAPHIDLLNKLELSYILGCKQGDHKSLFSFVDGSERLGTVSHLILEEDGIEHRFRFMNNVPLNDSNPDCCVNFIEYYETNKKGKVQHFSWVTDIEVNNDNIMKLMRGQERVGK